MGPPPAPLSREGGAGDGRGGRGECGAGRGGLGPWRRLAPRPSRAPTGRRAHGAPVPLQHLPLGPPPVLGVRGGERPSEGQERPEAPRRQPRQEQRPAVPPARGPPAPSVAVLAPSPGTGRTSGSRRRATAAKAVRGVHVARPPSRVGRDGWRSPSSPAGAGGGQCGGGAGRGTLARGEPPVLRTGTVTPRSWALGAVRKVRRDIKGEGSFHVGGAIDARGEVSLCGSAERGTATRGTLT